jgi:two-component system chemotaxis response regulator CheY
VRVLVVDDDSMTRLILRQVMHLHFDATVVEVENGFDALAALEHEQFDLAVVDLIMPVMDGLALLRTIRAAPRLSALPVVMLSANRTDDLVHESIRLGVNDYLTKPFRGAQIVSRLREVIDRIGARPPVAGDTRAELVTH